LSFARLDSAFLVRRDKCVNNGDGQRGRHVAVTTAIAPSERRASGLATKRSGPVDTVRCYRCFTRRLPLTLLSAHGALVIKSPLGLVARNSPNTSPWRIERQRERHVRSCSDERMLPLPAELHLF